MPLKRHTDLPAALPGFERIHRYWNAGHNGIMAKIKPGEYYVTRRGEAITTVLGSCVAACIRDPDQDIGGMNHFMLPVRGHRSSAVVDDALRYGNFAMEHLINDIMKYGGRKANLEIKVFGGANVGGIGQDVGKTNVEFILQYLRSEGYRPASHDLGGIQARKIVYFPTTGKILLKKLEPDKNIARQDQNMLETLSSKPVQGEVELFV
jgi:chemotaxis protein CheD